MNVLGSLGVAIGVLGSAVQAAKAEPNCSDLLYQSDPLFQAKGDHERKYKFVEAGIDSPYRIYVPSGWDGKKKLPLVVMLHGANLTHDAAFDREPANLKGELFLEAEKHGFILVAVEGDPNGSYGSTFPLALSQTLRPGPGAPGAARPGAPAAGTPSAGGAGVPARPIDLTAPELKGGMPPRPVLTPEEQNRASRLAERDVLNVIKIVSKKYTDPGRLYLMATRWE